jgi:hypothetical protein
MSYNLYNVYDVGHSLDWASGHNYHLGPRSFWPLGDVPGARFGRFGSPAASYGGPTHVGDASSYGGSTHVDSAYSGRMSRVRSGLFIHVDISDTFRDRGEG